MKMHLYVFSIYSFLEILAAFLYLGYSIHCAEEIKEVGDHHVELHDLIVEYIYVGVSAFISCLMFLTVLFLLHLVVTYARYEPEQCVEDDVLGKKVPIFVYIQN